MTQDTLRMRFGAVLGNERCARKGIVMMLVCACVLALLAGMAAPQQALAATTGTLFASDGTPLASSTVSADTDGNVALAEKSDAALLSSASYGIDSFIRQNKGTNKTYNDAYYGYRWTEAGEGAFSVVVGDSFAIVHIPQATADALGIDIADAKFQQDFLTTLVAIDRAAADGGKELGKLSLTYYFTTSDTVTHGDYTYQFDVQLEPGYYYTTCTLAGSDDGRTGAQYMESGQVKLAADTVVKEKATGLAALGAFFQKLDWSPLWVSLRTTLVAIAVIFILGLFAAWWTMRVNDRVKGILDTIFTIPMVLPPTVCGFLLLLLFGSSTAVGRWFIAHGLNIVFTWPAAVIACIVVGFPLMYRTVRGAFEALDPMMLDAARTLGWSEGKIFGRLMMPLAWPSIAAGTVLAFARAMGEFGCTLFFAGNYVGITQTIPIAIYFDWMGGQTDVALFWVIVVILISFAVILFINVYSSHSQRYRKRLGE